MNSLRNHPFAVEAYFESSVVLTFAVPKENLYPFIPKHLEPDTYNDKWGFIAVAMVQTKGLRPKGFPTFMGNDFFLIGYRIFVRYTSRTGKRLRGLYIIKSETDKKRMQFFGNLFTHYNYSTTDVIQDEDERARRIYSGKSGFEVVIGKFEKEISIPMNSPFSTWKDARRFAGPLPFTFTYNKTNDSILIIEGVRQNWAPEPIEVLNYQFSFLDSLKLDSVVLASAFQISNVPYYWKKGIIELWSR